MDIQCNHLTLLSNLLNIYVVILFCFNLFNDFFSNPLSDSLKFSSDSSQPAMNTVEFLFVLLVCALAAFVGYQVQLSSKKPELSTRVIRDMVAEKELVEHSKEFQKKEIRKVVYGLPCPCT